MIFPRKILPQIRKQITTKEIVVITGMRRVGKTTLCRALFEEIPSANKVFLDLENPLEQRIFEETDYNNIWANLSAYKITKTARAYLFLDEVQSAPATIKAVKYLFDHYDVKFFLTGSSSFYLKNLFPESLAGRKVVFDLFPLDFEEFLEFKGQPFPFPPTLLEKERRKNVVVYEKAQKLYEEYLTFGGFPQVVLAKDQEEKKMHLNDVFKSFFEKDVKLLSDFREINILRDLIILLMERVGSKLEISKIASELGVSRETIYSYLAFLEGTYFVNFISPFSPSPDREVSGAKKIYLCDNGFLNLFAKVSEGSLLENAVFNNLKKFGKINYYQRRSGAEIDFILGGKTAIEVKKTGVPSDLKKLKSLSFRLKIRENYIITKEFCPDQGFIPATFL